MDIVFLGIYTIALILFSKRIYEDPLCGLWFWLIFLVMDKMLNITPILNIGINVHLHDIVFIYFSIISILRYQFISYYANIDRQLRIFLYSLLFLILALPLFIIFAKQSLLGSFNGSRGFIIFTPAFIYFLSFNYTYRDLKKIQTVLIYIATSSAIIVFFMLLTNIGSRVIPSAAALFIAYGSLISLVKYYKEALIKDLIITLFLFLTVLLLRHRSVWIMLVLGIIYIHLYTKINTKLLGLILTLLLMAVYIPLLFPKKFERYSQSIAESASPFKSAYNFKNSTGGGRVARWEAQLENRLDWKVAIWGKGHGYDRKVYMRASNGELRLSTVSFHNHYLEQFFRTGVISVVILLLFISKFLILNHKLQSLRKDYLMLGISACIFGTIGFGMSYTYHFVTFIFMGIGYSTMIRYDEDY